MAKKSNKTAHVLNLLSGHDAAKEAEESASVDDAFSEEGTDTSSQSAPMGEGIAGNEPATAETSGAPEPQQSPAPVKAPVASQNNIS